MYNFSSPNLFGWDGVNTVVGVYEKGVTGVLLFQDKSNNESASADKTAQGVSTY